MNILETIQHAGRELKLLRIRYRKLNSEISERVVEPYEIRSDKGGPRLWAYDIEKNDGIRQFIITGILTAEVLEDSFAPRWDVQF